MKLQSCQNCWFNGLQYGSIGLARGYCVRHKVILNLTDETTCGQHLRKDLGLARALSVSVIHKRVYDEEKIVRLSSNRIFVMDASVSGKDIDLLRGDLVASAVLDYGFLESTIGALAQFKSIETARSDIALSSLGRAYISNCVSNGGKWTSGIHIYAWTRKRVARIPEIPMDDLRYSVSIAISEQAELAKCSVMMLKIYLLDDIIGYARQQNDDLGHEHGIADQAAEAVQTFDVMRLSRWIKKKMLPSLDARLNRDRYYRIADELRKESNISE